MSEAQEMISAMTVEVKRLVDDLFERCYKPRIERHLDLAVHGLVEQLVEKKIEERFAFAIDLLKSMTPSPAKLFCSVHPDVEALLYTDGPGPVKKQCVWCIRAEAVENFKKTAEIMAGNGI